MKVSNPARRSFGPAPIDIPPRSADTSVRDRVTISPQSQVFLDEKIPRGGTRSRPLRIMASEPRQNPVSEHERRFIAHVQRLKPTSELQPMNIDWEKLKKDHNLPIVAENRILSFMHVQNDYNVHSESQTAHHLVFQVFQHSNLVEKLAHDRDILHATVIGRVGRLQKYLTREGIIERSETTGERSGDLYKRTDSFNAAWLDRERLWNEPAQVYTENTNDKDTATQDSDSDTDSFCPVEEIGKQPSKASGNDQIQHNSKQTPLKEPTPTKRKQNMNQESPSPKNAKRVRTAEPSHFQPAKLPTPSREGISLLPQDDTSPARQLSPATSGIQFGLEYLFSSELNEQLRPTTPPPKSFGREPVTPTSIPRPPSIEARPQRINSPQGKHTPRNFPTNTIGGSRRGISIWFYIQNERKRYQERIDYACLLDKSASGVFDELATIAVGSAAESVRQLAFRYTCREEDVLERDDPENVWNDIKLNVERNERFVKMEDPLAREVEVLVGVYL